MAYENEYYLGTNSRDVRVQPARNSTEKEKGAVVYIEGAFLTSAQARILATTLLKLADGKPRTPGRVRYLPSGEREETE